MNNGPDQAEPQPEWLVMSSYPNLGPDDALPAGALAALRGALHANQIAPMPPGVWETALRHALHSPGDPSPAPHGASESHARPAESGTGHADVAGHSYGAGESGGAGSWQEHDPGSWGHPGDGMAGGGWEPGFAAGGGGHDPGHGLSDGNGFGSHGEGGHW